MEPDWESKVPRILPVNGQGKKKKKKNLRFFFFRIGFLVEKYAESLENGKSIFRLGSRIETTVGKFTCGKF
jgi:hypothetical protein